MSMIFNDEVGRAEDSVDEGSLAVFFTHRDGRDYLFLQGSDAFIIYSDLELSDQADENSTFKKSAFVFNGIRKLKDFPEKMQEKVNEDSGLPVFSYGGGYLDADFGPFKEQIEGLLVCLESKGRSDWPVAIEVQFPETAGVE